jgi:hypothetical protein
MNSKHEAEKAAYEEALEQVTTHAARATQSRQQANKGMRSELKRGKNYYEKIRRRRDMENKFLDQLGQLKSQLVEVYQSHQETTGYQKMQNGSKESKWHPITGIRKEGY